MSVNRHRTYAAYARVVPAAEGAGGGGGGGRGGRGGRRSGPSPDSRRLRARAAVCLRPLVSLCELPHHLVAPAVHPPHPPLFPPGERLRSEDRKSDGVVETAHHR